MVRAEALTSCAQHATTRVVMESEQDLSEESFPWSRWFEAELGMHSTLQGCALATSIQEEVAERVFWVFVASWRRRTEPRNPRAWARRVTRNELWNKRRHGHHHCPLDDEVELAAESEDPAPHLPDDPWAVIKSNELKIVTALSELERRVFEYLRDHRSLKGCGERLGMSPRDVRIRLRRICAKLGGTLPGSVPPLPLLLTGRSRSRGSTMQKQSLAVIPLIAFLLCAFSATPLSAPGDACDLWVTSDFNDPPSWEPSCHGTCTPGGCTAPQMVVTGTATRWWCECNGVRFGQDALCDAVLIYDSFYWEDPWVGRCYQHDCATECVDFPLFPQNPQSLILCPCF